jgi:hypothetical protein
MDFATFLSSASKPEFWTTTVRFCFIGNEYPITFFGTLFDTLSKKSILPSPYQRLFLESTEKRLLHATLSQSMLGSTSFYWLGNVSEEKETKGTQETINMFMAYKGPHTLAFFLSSESKFLPKKSDDLIRMDSMIDYSSFQALMLFVGASLDAKKQSFAKSLFAANTSISLDLCCMLLNYLDLISSKYLDDYTPYLTSLVGSLPSLSLLSELFFAKNTQRFFQVWAQVSKEYPDVFWIVFWSEQLWKACHVTRYLHEKDFVQAKRMSFRLPYTFINRDWQKSSTKELACAYEFLYHMDYALKNGSTFCGLDLFYMNYFMGTFA